MKLKNMLYIALSAVFIAVCSWIIIPLPIPVSMQTFSIFLLLFVFGGKSTFFSALLYILLGFMGAPVFAGFRGGISVLFSNTGGYLPGFLLATVIYMLFSSVNRESKHARILSALAGLLICYVCGLLWYMGINSLMTFEGFKASFVICVMPFIIPDILKLLLAFSVSGRISAGIYRLNSRR